MYYQFFSRLSLYSTILLIFCCHLATAQTPDEKQFYQRRQTQNSANQQAQSRGNFDLRNGQHQEADQHVDIDADSSELEAALLELENVNAQNTQVLQGLLTQVPPQARPAIENALKRSQLGRQKAQQARMRATERKQFRQNTKLNRSGQPRVQGSEGGGRPEWAGNQDLRARGQTSGQTFDRSPFPGSQNATGADSRGQRGSARNSGFTQRPEKDIWNQSSELSPSVIGQNANGQGRTMQPANGQSTFGQSANGRNAWQQSFGGQASGNSSSGQSSSLGGGSKQSRGNGRGNGGGRNR